MSSKLRKIKRHMYSADDAAKCDLLEAWCRNNPYHYPPVLMLGWVIDLARRGGGDLFSVKSHPHLVAFILHLYRSAREDGADALRTSGLCAMWLATAARRWISSGCPHIALDEQIASALMLTHSSVAPSLNLPWPTFTIAVPETVFPMYFRNATTGDVASDPTDVPFDTVFVGEALVVDQAEAPMAITLCRMSDTHDPIIVAGRMREDVDLVAFSTVNDKQRQVADLIVNLVRGVLLHCEAGKIQQAPAVSRSGKQQRKPGALPVTTDFVLGTDVKIKHDCVAHMRAVVAGIKKYGKVQWTVRGHQRWQACGPEHRQRKLIWVPPYWKGPVDAPILRRDYTITDQAEKGEERE